MLWSDLPDPSRNLAGAVWCCPGFPTAPSAMARIRRPNQSTGWMAGYRPADTSHAAALELEQRLRQREGLREPFADAIARLPLSELERWSD